MAKKNKVKMPMKKFLALTIPFAAICLALAIAVPIVANAFAPVLDTYVGAGETQISGGTNVSYYDTNSKTAKEAHSAARVLTEEIASEGVILMKNDGALPLKTSKSDASVKDKKITLFGRRSVENIYGGTGSGQIEERLCENIYDGLKNAGYDVNDTVYDMYKKNLSDVPVAKVSMDKPSEATYYIGEFPRSYYTNDITKTYKDYSDAAIVVLGRQAGEGYDFCADLKGSISSGETAMSNSVAETANYVNGQHQLELCKEEQDLIKHAKANFKTVVVVINSTNVMELGGLDAKKTDDNLGVDAILWCGAPGTTGFSALGNVLNGKVNPSGRTVDTWINDLTKEPSFNNFVTASYSNINASDTADKKPAYFMDYEEGIYVGYRYYETAYAEHEAGNYSGFDYDSLVTYPFGYGLSYTDFSWEIVEENTSSAPVDGTITVRVKVTNDGDVAGKDVVQLYYSAPYTAGGVEKSAVNLAAFAKTGIIEPGDNDTVTLSFSVEDMASYNYKHENATGTVGCYQLDAGDYTISLRENSHNIKENCAGLTYNVANTTFYIEGTARQSETEAQKGETRNISDEAKSTLVVQAATNKFEYMNEHFREYGQTAGGSAVNLTRSDFKASFPTAPAAGDLIAPQNVIDDFKAYTPDYYDPSDKAPVTGAKNGIDLISVRGLPYDDELWDKLLDELTVTQMVNLLMNGQYQTVGISAINKPRTVDYDGPAGIHLFGSLSPDDENNGYGCGTMLASTWNVVLAKAFGECVGEEAVWNKQNGRLNGWYAPGCNMHRSSFSGRNFEYYSEDPLIAGLMCKNTIEGATSKGLYCYVKHFVLNDVDTNRTGNGLAAWANEQALREIYLRAFEIAVKGAKTNVTYFDAAGNKQIKTMRACTGLMATYTRIGSKADACSSELAEVLRGEWGFLGTVITDTNSLYHTHVEDCIVNLADLQLTVNAIAVTKVTNPSNPSTQIALRKATKNVLYTVVHSSAMEGISAGAKVSTGVAPWHIYVGLISGFFALGAIALAALDILHYFQLKKAKLDPSAAAGDDSAGNNKNNSIQE